MYITYNPLTIKQLMALSNVTHEFGVLTGTRSPITTPYNYGVKTKFTVSEEEALNFSSGGVSITLTTPSMLNRTFYGNVYLVNGELNYEIFTFITLNEELTEGTNLSIDLGITAHWNEDQVPAYPPVSVDAVTTTVDLDNVFPLYDIIYNNVFEIQGKQDLNANNLLSVSGSTIRFAGYTIVDAAGFIDYLTGMGHNVTGTPRVSSPRYMTPLGGTDSFLPISFKSNDVVVGLLNPNLSAVIPDDILFEFPKGISFTISFSEYIGDEVIPTFSTRDVVINFTTPPVIRSIIDVINIFAAAGFTTQSRTRAATTILAERNGSSGSSTSTTITINPILEDVNITTTVNNPSSDAIDDLETKIQANTDLINAQTTFVNTVSDALNRNVNEAIHSSAETRDLLVGLQLGTIASIESRLSALENE